MLKRIFALLLCVLMLVPAFASCAQNTGDEDPGAYITMYLTDEIYDFDPAKAFYNSGTVNIVSLLFDTLYTLDSNGNIQKLLAKEDTRYVNENGENVMHITLNSNACWSTGDPVTADDVVWSWKRLVNVNNNYEAASLLYDIKNARAIKQGDESLDNLGAEALSSTVIKITFEGNVDYDQFLLNLTNVATAPVKDNKNADWAKKGSTLVSSGAYKLGKTKYVNVIDPNSPEGKPYQVKDDNSLDGNGDLLNTTYKTFNMKKLSYFILERNSYYYRDTKRDAIDSSVRNFRILVDCSKTDAEVLEAYKNGEIFYMGKIPYSLRNSEAEYLNQNVQLSDTLSTFTCFLNENALIDDGAEGTKLFAIKEVRKALSLAIDRTAIAEKVVYAEPATGLVSPGVLNAGVGSGTFRDAAGEALVNQKSEKAAAQALLATAQIVPSNYTFTISVPKYDDVSNVIAEMLVKAWGPEGLGFNVSVKVMETIQNNDILKALEDLQNEESRYPSDVCDDQFVEAIERAKYEVIAFDYCAFTADAYSMLANFAKPFSGMAIDMNSETYDPVPHRTGYDSKAYNDLMEAIYYIPYFASLDREKDADFLGIYSSLAEFQKVYDTVKAIYDENGITPTNNSGEWKYQKAQLLHKAEELLMEEMPVIPVINNKNAIMISDQLSEVYSGYYSPAHFRWTALKDYGTYTYTVVQIDPTTNKNEYKIVSIFEKFPVIAWEKQGKYYDPMGNEVDEEGNKIG